MIKTLALAVVLSGIVVALVLGCAAAKPGVPPTKVGASLFVCDASHDVAGYVSARFGKVAFPAMHPLHPAITVHPARCFATLSAATHAGYQSAAPPPKAVVLSGIYLRPVSRNLRAACHTSARAAGFAVPCPGLLPAAQQSWQCPCVGEFGFNLMVFASAPPAYDGEGPGSIHLVFGASRDASSPWVNCIGAVGLGAMTLGGIRGALLNCPPASEGPNGGHLVFRWTGSGVTYTVSAHGHTAINRRLIAVLLEHLTLIAPR